MAPPCADAGPQIVSFGTNLGAPPTGPWPGTTSVRQVGQFVEGSAQASRSASNASGVTPKLHSAPAKHTPVAGTTAARFSA